MKTTFSNLIKILFYKMVIILHDAFLVICGLILLGSLVWMNSAPLNPAFFFLIIINALTFLGSLIYVIYLEPEGQQDDQAIALFFSSIAGIVIFTLVNAFSGHQYYAMYTFLGTLIVGVFFICNTEGRMEQIKGTYGRKPNVSKPFAQRRFLGIF